jgi:outer membrane protein OmpA-like peptidoglycan-associated protein
VTARAFEGEDNVESIDTMTKYSARALLAAALCATAWACGSTAPTAQLVDARRAYERAQLSPASQYTPDDLLTARQALDRAEAAHEEDPGSSTEAHLAYLADRKAQMAEARGEIAQSKAVEAKARADYQSKLEHTAASSQQALSKTRGELDTARKAQSSAEAGRMEAEKRASAALQSLSQVATVKEEQRGMVITLAGNVLFPSGGDVLSPIAQQSLDQVAKALEEQSPETGIVIEGHTDSRGSTSTNDSLSQRRAQAVANYLATRGIESTRIQAVGRGENQPIASNDTTDGRASNRRVEIIVGGSSSAQGATFGTVQKPTPGGAAAKSMPQPTPAPPAPVPAY